MKAVITQQMTANTQTEIPAEAILIVQLEAVNVMQDTATAMETKMTDVKQT